MTLDKNLSYDYSNQADRIIFIHVHMYMYFNKSSLFKYHHPFKNLRSFGDMILVGLVV